MNHIRRIAIYIALLLTTQAYAQWNTERITAIGRNALYFDDYVLSIQYFNQVIKIKPYLADPYIYRAIAKVQLSDYSGALQDCNKAVELNPFLPGAYYIRGYIYRQLQDYDKSEQDFTQALQFAPENKTYILLRADVRAQQKHYDQALADIDILLKREPNSAQIHFEKGTIQLAAQDTLGACNSFDKAVIYDQRNPINWSAKALTNMMLGKDDEALSDLNQAVKLGSKWSGDYLNRGSLYYKKHNYRGAIADFDKAVELAPDNMQCWYNRAILRNELGDYNRALADINHALDLDTSKAEIRYQRGLINMQLRQWQTAIKDFQYIIERYPYFLPSYYLAAQASKSAGKTRQADIYLYKAQQLEKNKDKIQKQQQLNTDIQTADNQPAQKNRRKEFSSKAAQNIQETNEDIAYKSDTRGAIQKNYADVINEPNIILTYYSTQTTLRQTNYSHLIVDLYNKKKSLPAKLKLTYQEYALEADIIEKHFETINSLTQDIASRQPDDTTTADYFFARAIEFAIVQDYNSAIEDINSAVAIRPDFTLAYFCRANWRYKLLQYINSTADHALLTTATSNNIPTDQLIATNMELILRDYDEVIRQQPTFSYAYYNKANILCSKQNYTEAISLYTETISLDHDFAESYFNRGLVHIYIGQTQTGIDDLSKAGELGIYQAYNLITRLK